jgi:hypothetical protein
MLIVRTMINGEPRISTSRRLHFVIIYYYQVIAVGYETVTVVRSNFNALQSYWWCVNIAHVFISQRILLISDHLAPCKVSHISIFNHCWYLFGYLCNCIYFYNVCSRFI